MAVDNELEVEWVSPNDLHAFPNNPRVHHSDQINQLAASYHEFGWTVPLIVDEDDMILAGHGRWEMARQNGIEQIPVIVKAGLSEEQKRAYVIADNKLSANSSWDMALLATEVALLQTAEFNTNVLGFNDVEMLSFSSPMDDLAFPAGAAPDTQTDPDADADDRPAARGRGRPIQSSTDPTQMQEGADPDAANANETATGGPTAEVAHSLVPFSLMVPHAQREEIFGVVNRAKDMFGCSTADALIRILNEWNDANQDEAPTV